AGTVPTARTTPPAANSPTYTVALDTAEGTPAATATSRDKGERSPLVEQIDLSARRGAEWLFRMNNTTGRFVYGIVPALNAVKEGDHYLRQVGAAYALARAARITRDATYAARATQAVLALADETVTDPSDPQVRHSPLPSIA